MDDVFIESSALLVSLDAALISVTSCLFANQHLASLNRKLAFRHGRITKVQHNKYIEHKRERVVINTPTKNVASASEDHASSHSHMAYTNVGTDHSHLETRLQTLMFAHIRRRRTNNRRKKRTSTSRLSMAEVRGTPYHCTLAYCCCKSDCSCENLQPQEHEEGPRLHRRRRDRRGR